MKKIEDNNTLVRFGGTPTLSVPVHHSYLS